MAVFLFLIIFSITSFSNDFNIKGYFTSWGIYGDNPYTVDDIPFEHLTHIKYAFFEPETDGSISSSDPWADQVNFQNNNLVEKAHESSVKVLPSIGGWTLSSNFSAIAASAENRANFAHSCVNLINRYNLDGIDIDWEYPGFATHNGTPDDAENFVTLLRQLRDTLNTNFSEHKLITLAIAGTDGHGSNFLVEQFYEYVDYISVMTYDYTGAWDQGNAWHNSPLYSYGSNNNWSVERAMDYYLSRGIPANKYNIGLAFYGRSFSDCQGPNTPFSQAGPGESGEPGYLFYSSIERGLNNSTYDYNWDQQAQVPYITNSQGDYASYDDTVSLRLKVEYAIENGFAGAIIWELKPGRIDDGSQPLLEAVYNASQQLSTLSQGFDSDNKDFNLKISPNPFNPVLNAQFSIPQNTQYTFGIYNTKGELIYKHYGVGEKKLINKSVNLKDYSSGVYFIKIVSKYSATSKKAVFLK